MSIWDKIKNKDDFEEDEQEELAQEQPEETQAPKKNPSGSTFGRGGVAATALELKVVRPESYDVAGKIADHLLDRKTVVLNLEATNKETARRLIDFLSGVAYSINGTIKRVAANTFIITPCNVGITGESEGAKEPKAAPKAEPADDFSF